jgi:hypothetical protein
MEWYSSQDNYHLLFDKCQANDTLGRGIVSLQHKTNFNFVTLSANQNSKAMEITTNFIIDNFNIDRKNIIFVERWYDKIKFMEKNYQNFGNKEDILFIDDRIQTIKQFEEKGFNAYWYTKYYEQRVIDSNMYELKFIPQKKGSTYNLLQHMFYFLNNNGGN